MREKVKRKAKKLAMKSKEKLTPSQKFALRMFLAGLKLSLVLPVLYFFFNNRWTEGLAFTLVWVLVLYFIIRKFDAKARA